MEGGVAGVVVAALIAVGTLLALLAVDVARVVAARAQLTVAADAAALAAAPSTFATFGTSGDPVAAATASAAANGASLLECDCVVDRSWSTRRVVVVVGLTVDLGLLGDRELRAAAAAEFRPIALGQRSITRRRFFGGLVSSSRGSPSHRQQRSNASSPTERPRLWAGRSPAVATSSPVTRPLWARCRWSSSSTTG